MIGVFKIPSSMKTRRQWIVWKTVERDGNKTKLPFQITGEAAKSNDPATWNEFATVLNFFSKRRDYDGIGYVFSNDDPFCGIDLDGCRDPESGKVADWAREIILSLDSYAEVSPSLTGIKVFIKGKLACENGRKKILEGVESSGGKAAAIEIYDHLRYFAVTGMKVLGPDEPQDRQQKLDELTKRFFPEEQTRTHASEWYSPQAVVERARKYIAKMPPAVSGQNGHTATFKVACVLVLGFGLSESESLALMHEFNQTCNPPWSDKELNHKIRQAAKQSGERNYLRNIPFERWGSIEVPTYQEPPRKSEPKRTTLVDSMRRYVTRLEAGEVKLLETGIPDVDYAIGGGVEKGELIVVAARTSHGKSVMGLQAVHEWTGLGRPCLIISEEMSSLALGKRGIQYASEVPEEHWRNSVSYINKEIDNYATDRAGAIIVESCGNVENAVEEIDRAVAEDKIEMAVVDYAQILGAKGKTKYEQVSAVSVAIKQAAARHGIVILLLCQLSREIERRQKFIPTLADIKESGQIEQDADVIMFLVWPHKIDSKNPPELYQVFVAKNRNRAIMSPAVECRFLPSRQMILAPRVQDRKNYTKAFDQHNQGVLDGTF